MKLKTKVIIAGLVVIAINIMLFNIFGLTSTMRGYGGIGNSIEDADSASEVEAIVKYDIQFPQFLEAVNEKDIHYEIVNNTNTQIYNSRFRFCTAPFVAYNVSVVGNYSTFEFDRYYQATENTNDIQYVRYRTDGETTIVEWFTSSYMYGLQMENYDGYNGMDALIDGVFNGEISIEQLVECSDPVTGGDTEQEQENLIDNQDETDLEKHAGNIDTIGQEHEQEQEMADPQPAPPPVIE